MCPPKGRKPKRAPLPIEAPEVDLGSEATTAAGTRKRKARGRNQLRTGLSVGSFSPSGLNIPS